jgi:hypothetical protein
MDIHQSGTPEIRRLYTFSLEREEYWRELESKYPFDWALVARVTFAADRLPDFFDADSTWALVFQDDAAMLFVHRTGPMRAVAERAAYRVVPAGNLKLDGVAQRLRDDAALRAQFRAELERMTRESKWTSQARTLLAQLNLLEGKRAEAIEELDRAIEIDPHNDALRKDRAALKR